MTSTDASVKVPGDETPEMVVDRAAWTAAAGALLALVALIFDAAPLLVAAVALVGLGALAPLWVWAAARGAGAQRRLRAERVIEGQPFEAAIDVRRGWLAMVRVVVIDPLTGSRFNLAELQEAQTGTRRDRRTTVRVRGRFERRGLHRLPPPSLIVSDPLELATAHRRAPGPGEDLLVLPATERVRWTGPGQARRMHQPDGHDATEAMAAVDLDGLRPYRPGTPASRIHWPAVARGAGLLERRLQSDGDSRPLVVLDVRTPASSTPVELVDAAVRAAASLVLEFARGGGCGLLLPGEHRASVIDRELAAWPAAYARLAVVQGGPGARAPVLGPGGRTGATIYVAAITTERLVGRLAGSGTGPTVLVVPCTGLVGGRPRGIRGSVRPALTVSGCQGFLVGAARAAEGSRPVGPAA